MLDNRAFTQYVQPRVEKMRRLIISILGSDREADDVLQDLLMKLLEKIDADNPPSSSWYYTTTRNHTFDVLRHKKNRAGREHLPLVSDYPTTTDMDRGVEREENRRLVGIALRMLPQRERCALLLFVNDYSYQEIATRMQVTTTAVKAMLSRARALLHVLFPDGTASVERGEIVIPERYREAYRLASLREHDAERGRRTDPRNRLHAPRANPEQHKEYMRWYRRTERGKQVIRARQRIWRSENPEKMRAQRARDNHKRRSKIHGQQQVQQQVQQGSTPFSPVEPVIQYATAGW
jgi:RNA polymerase sigma factor (sigma-70 family)